MFWRPVAGLAGGLLVALIVIFWFRQRWRTRFTGDPAKSLNPRDFSHNKHGQVDDTPYGGGAGMLMMA